MLYLTILTALAHKPSFGDSYISEESAYPVSDPNISIVVYQELTCENPELWLAFDAPDDFELYVQLGVPVVEWLDGYQPTVAVVAEGLPAADTLPFSIPDGMGAVIYEAADTPDTFYEPFTQTESWVWVEERLQVSGKGYIVGWHPADFTGKIWLATGEVEDFSDVEIADFIYWTEAVNNFHETGRFAFPEPQEVQSCSPLEEEGKPASCAAISSSDWSLLTFCGGLLGLSLRRRRS